MLTPVRSDVLAIRRTNLASRAREIPAHAWILGAVIAVGAALRFATIASQSYWFDEATTVGELHRSFGGMLHAVATNESTPPLYYVVAWVWAKVFGTGAAGLRSLSALAGVAAIPVAYLCGRDLVSRAAGLVAAALTAVSPFLIWYSQEARAYMLFALFCGLSFWFFVRVLQDPSIKNLAWWTACSSLAVLTHFFAGFLVAPEALWLLIVLRDRATVIAAGIVAAVQAALVPLLIGDVGHPLVGWIKEFPLSVRIEQVPVALGLGTLYQSAAVKQGLLAAAILAVVVAGLVIFGADRRGRRGAALAAAVAACVILVPLLLAEVGHDYYIARNLIGAWTPLVVLVAIACTAPRTLPVGAALAALLLGSFVVAQVKIESDALYQRPDWRGVAAALGRTSTERAIVAYDGSFAVVPLALYLPHSILVASSSAPLRIGEVDVVGSVWQTVNRRLPSGVKLLGAKAVNQYLVARFEVTPAWRLAPAEIAARAPGLVGPAPAGAELLVQRPAA